MRPFLRAASGVLLAVCAAQASAVTLSPNAIGGGDIPGTHSIVDFYTHDGNWAPSLRLPASALPGATITIHANATYASNLVLDNTDLPLPAMTLSTGDTIRFTFDAGALRWAARIPDHSPGSVGAGMPAQNDRIARYSFSDGDWTALVTLPATAVPGAIVIVRSSATRDAGVAPANVLHASTLRLSAGERYVFVFHPELKKWYLLQSPVAALGPQDLDRGGMRATTRPRTELTLPAGVSGLAIRLPTTAGDRDRVRVKSDSLASNEVRNDGVDFAGTLRVARGQAYDFMWVAEKGRWVVMASPTARVDAKALPAGQMPDMDTPTVRLRAADGNWTSRVVLPAQAKPGDRVIVESSASRAFDVVPGTAAAGFAAQAVTNGDTIAFVVDARRGWTRETRTIDMLNVYADKVVAAYGAQAARARQLESFRLTNEALENSGANFRLRMVGLMQHRDQGATLYDALVRLRSDAVVQGERRRLRADAVYYEGGEDGCGLAWVNAYPSFHDMTGTGSIQCGTTVMRHEFGHNMGLQHAGTPSVPVYATGNSLLGTVMGGNGIPYYATPARYDAQLGVAMGVAGRIDAVRAMNENAAAVAAFYR